ncbi:MAG TPA: radical SAM protein [Candidatus Dormibacteraeota bacterium]|nr:radical SAM protein [Candidatus Dormibacteraeota bacterium]
MSRRQQLRLAGRFLRHRFRTLHPFEVQAVLLNACNLRCTYCSCPDLKTALLTTEQWLDVIRSLGAVGTMRLKWQGGEPTLRNDFRALCAAVQAAGILCAVVTNGTKVAEDPTLLAHVDEVVFSLDSIDPALTDAVRGAGVHAAVTEAIEVARRLPHRPRLFINMVVMRPNLGEIEPMLRYCEARGLGLNVQPAVFGLPYYDDAAKPLALDEQQTREMYRTLAGLKRAGRSLMFAAATYDHAGRWPDYGTLSRPSDGPSSCVMGRVYVHIEANGDVYPCVQSSATVRPKNIIRDGFDAALTHVQRHNCGDCYSAYLNERKALFGLRPAAVVEYLRRG